mgnify:CR=1 FL=1
MNKETFREELRCGLLIAKWAIEGLTAIAAMAAIGMFFVILQGGHP